MINTIIVDDDVEMLDGLSSLICWEDYGFRIAGKAKNGFEALKLVSRYMPDVIITDITMPVMGGLELLSEAKKFRPEIHGVIISCHEEFEYAREAIRLEADEYLIKHTLTEEVLTGTILSLKEKIDKRKSRREELSLAIRGLNLNRYAIFGKFFGDVIEGGFFSDDQIRRQAEVSAIPLPPSEYRVAHFFTDDPNEPSRITEQYGSFEYCVSNIIENTLPDSEGFVLFPFEQYSFVLLFWGERGDFSQLVKEAQSNVKSVLGVLLSVCAGGVCTSLMELKDAVTRTAMLRDAYFYKGSGAVVTQPEVYPQSDLSAVYMEYVPRLKQAARDPEALLQTSNELLELQYRQYEPSAVKSMLNRLLIETAYYASGFDVPRIDGKTFQLCKKEFEEVIRLISGNIGSPPAAHAEILKALEYIDAHLGEDISCEGVASYINMNNSYFSRLFKREMHVNFSDYLLKKRMQAATELLIHSNCPVDEIMSAIGIESVSYFYRAYKRITGCTPGDARNRARQKASGNATPAIKLS